MQEDFSTQMFVCSKKVFHQFRFKRTRRALTECCCLPAGVLHSINTSPDGRGFRHILHSKTLLGRSRREVEILLNLVLHNITQLNMNRSHSRTWRPTEDGSIRCFCSILENQSGLKDQTALIRSLSQGKLILNWILLSGD